MQSQSGLKPMAQKVKLPNRNNKVTVGVPKEIFKDEKRVSLTPEDVFALTSEEFDVIVESNAGIKSNYTDLQYSEAGAMIVKNSSVVYKNSSIIAKIAPLTNDEIELVQPGSIIFSAINLSTQNPERIQKLQEKKITALAYEFYNDNNGFNPFNYIIGQIIGSSSVMIASELLSNSNGGKGIMLGGLTGMPPTEIVILGSDISSEYATRIALGLGATVKVFDFSIANFIRFHNLFGQHLFTSTITYANLSDAISRADVIINTLERRPGKNFIITEEMLLSMKERSVIIDLKVDAGSIIQTSDITTLENPTFIKHGVIHYCVPNIASRVAQTSSAAISNLLSNIILKILQQGSIIPLLQYENELRNSAYLFKGILTNKIVADTMNLSYTDINLIIHVF